MRVLALTFVGLALLSAPAWATLPLGGAAATATPNNAGARPARLKISLRLELRCGKPGPAAIVVSLPRAWRVPKSVSRSSVWIDRAHPKAVSVTGHRVTLMPMAPTGTCTVIGPGTVTVVFTRAAKLGNPRKAGRYVLQVSVGRQKLTGRVTIVR